MSSSALQRNSLPRREICVSTLRAVTGRMAEECRYSRSRRMSIFTIKKNVDIHDQKEKSRICQVVGPLGLAPPSQSGFGQPEPERERAGAKNDPAASARNPEPPALRSQSVKSAWRKIGPMNTRAENNLAFRAPSDPLPSPDPLPPPEPLLPVPVREPPNQDPDNPDVPVREPEPLDPNQI